MTHLYDNKGMFSHCGMFEFLGWATCEDYKEKCFIYKKTKKIMPYQNEVQMEYTPIRRFYACIGFGVTVIAVASVMAWTVRIISIHFL